MGSSASGKSTLARTLSKQLNIEVYHIDRMFWKSGWVSIGADALKEELEKVTALDEWIIDGNYSKTLDVRLPRATHIIYLERSTIGNLFRAFKRRMMYRNQSRPDIAEGCPEKIDLEFIMWILTFKRRNKDLLNELKMIDHFLLVKKPKNVTNILEWLKEKSK